MVSRAVENRVLEILKEAGKALSRAELAQEYGRGLQPHEYEYLEENPNVDVFKETIGLVKTRWMYEYIGE